MPPEDTAGPAPGFPEHPDHMLSLERSPKRVRLVFGGTTVVDTINARLLRESGQMPVYYFSRSDVRMDCLSATHRTTRCPFKGDASYWTLIAGGRSLGNAVWSYERPFDEAADLVGLLAFDWDAADRRLEEDEEVFGHPRDPHHRIDVRPSRRQVRVVLNGKVVADSRRALFLFETGLRTRYYLPPEDVRTDLLTSTPTTSICPYKGKARYWSAAVGDRTYEDVVWAYPEPLPEQPRLANRLCFSDEKVDELMVEDRNDLAKDSPR